MADIVTHKKRSKMMAGIKNKDTKPEMIIRKSLHAKGFRYRVNDKRLPGKPDIVFPKYEAVIQINGCFWHGHNCHLFKWPSTREEFWKNKIRKNKERDHRNVDDLHNLGWRTLIVWECSLRGKNRMPLDLIIKDISHWLLSDELFREIIPDNASG